MVKPHRITINDSIPIILREDFKYHRFHSRGSADRKSARKVANDRNNPQLPFAYGGVITSE